MSSIAGMRKEYRREDEFFDFEHLVSKEPFGQFAHWFETASNTEGIYEANAMALATATRDGKPSSRMVLMKGFDKDGFKFFTNYDSRKGKELEDNPRAALLFYWTNAQSHDSTLARQVRIEGRVERLNEAESEEYFHSRPKESQLSACSSKQSSVIPSRETLTHKFEDLKKEFAEKECPKPANWGGFLVRPERFEFWQGQTNRLHDRICFRRPKSGETSDSSITHQGEDGWVYERLSS